MKLVNMLGDRFRETPADCQIISQIFMIRGGYMKQVANGIYTLLPPARRIVRKIENIIREEMDRIDGQEVLFPVVMPADLWRESGRFDSIGSELARFKDRGGNDMVLGMTHEEASVQLVRGTPKPESAFPFMIYQIQTKFRDEPRARGGLIRVREFTMKDAYSFHTSQADLEKYYDRCYHAYERIYARCGVPEVIAVKSDSGMMGGNISHEFMLLTDIGEDTIVTCPECGTRLVREEGESGYYCPNQDGCPPQIVGRLEHFVSRKAMDIENLGSERLQMLYSKGIVSNVADLYDLRRDQLVGLESDVDDATGRRSTIQDKGADNILAAIAQSRQVPFERVLFALGIRYVGEVGAKKLARYFQNIDALACATVEQLADVEDVGEKTAAFIYDYLHDLRHIQLIERLRQAGLQFKLSTANSQVSNVLQGKTFVVSGVFSRFSRDEIKAHVEQHGGKISGSISGKTDYLLAGEKMGPEKLKKAEKLGIPIISEEEYLNMVQ